MSDKKIQVELTEAEALVVAEALEESQPAYAANVRVAKQIRAALPPEYPEGQLAWVTAGSGRVRHKAYLRRGQWWTMSGDGSSDLQPIWKVEPLRVLKDDEIAVKQPTNADGLVVAARVLEHEGFAWVQGWLRDVAARLDAEADS